MQQVGNSLINLHQSSDGGWRFISQIQAPHYQTDRDVGAASIGIGFLALANKFPNDPRWINAADNTAGWLIAVSSQDSHGGRYWHDYVDDTEISKDVYTSFDDGTVGISDFFWQLYSKTHDSRYKAIALEGLNWTFSQAELVTQDGTTGYRWKWDMTDPNSPYYMGMGEGQEGIIYALATFYDRLKTSDPAVAAECQKYISGGLAYIEIVKKNLANSIGSSATIPETGVVGQNGDTTLDSGYLSGAAGGAYMYFKLYQTFGDKTYLNKAESLLSWLSDSRNGPLVDAGNQMATWRLALDPQAGDDNHHATGMEEGSTGIGWTFLQAYLLTGDKQYIQMAESAGNWLLNVAKVDNNEGLVWHEDEHPVNGLIHVNLNNGSSGIGTFLYDLYLVTGQQKYWAASERSLKGIRNLQQGSGSRIYWNDNGGNDPYSNDPSWHWGDAGIVEFVQRLDGGSIDMPGEQPSLAP